MLLFVQKRQNYIFYQIQQVICQFTLVKDTTDGRHVQTAYQNPQGDPFMWIYHNRKDRVNGNYLNIPYSEKLQACQEMLRLMGDMSGLHQTFYGEMILLNCESSAPRAV